MIKVLDTLFCSSFGGYLFSCKKQDEQTRAKKEERAGTPKKREGL